MLVVVTLILLALVLQASLTTKPPTTSIHHGRTVRVPEDHHSIAEALASSQPNDRILIGPGTYYEMLELPNHDVMLVSTDGPELTMIDGGSNSLHVLPQPSVLSNGVIRMGPYAGQVELQGLTIQHGWSNEGGGLRVAGGVVTAKDCHIKRCNSIFGGAVGMLGGRVELNQCTLVDCGATFGGGVAVITGELGLNNTSTERCIAQASGGGAWCDNGGTLNASDSTWKHCHAAQGGGLGIQGFVQLERSSVQHCRSEGHGGGLQLTAAASGMLRSVKFGKNQAAKGGGISVEAGASLSGEHVAITSCTANRGGGLATLGRSTLQHLTIRSCQADTIGGAIALGRAHPHASLTITDTTLEDNHAQYGAALYGDPTGALTLVDAVLTNNHAEDQGGGVHLHGVDCTLTNVHFTNNRSANTTDVFFRDGQLFLNNVTRTGPVYGIQAFSLDGPNLKVRLGPPSNH